MQAHVLGPEDVKALALLAGFLSRLLLAFDQQDRTLALYMPEVNLTRVLPMHMLPLQGKQKVRPPRNGSSVLYKPFRPPGPSL